MTIQGKLDVVPIEDKMGETRLRWFGHVQKRQKWCHGEHKW